MSRVRTSSPAPALVCECVWLANVADLLSFTCSVGNLKRPCGSVVEHSLGKGEVAGPIPAMGTKSADAQGAGVFGYRFV